jgi:hypothetical protein
VLALQRRLVTLWCWLGQQDGHYGSSTTHAVTAFQKASGLRRDGIAGPATANALDRAARPRPRSTAGRLVEIDLRRQLLLVVADGRVRWVMDTSTGAVAGTTATGRHIVLREIDECHTSPPRRALPTQVLRPRHGRPRLPGRAAMPRLARLRTRHERRHRLAMGPRRPSHRRTRLGLLTIGPAALYP